LGGRGGKSLPNLCLATSLKINVLGNDIAGLKRKMGNDNDIEWYRNALDKNIIGLIRKQGNDIIYRPSRVYK